MSTTCFLSFIETRGKQNKTKNLKVMKVRGRLLQRWEGKEKEGSGG
jgi:hypothetical protein